MQADPKVFGVNMANCSLVNGMRSFLDEETDHRAIDYFPGLEQFREHGAPLPVAGHRA